MKAGKQIDSTYIPMSFPPLYVDFHKLSENAEDFRSHFKYNELGTTKDLERSLCACVCVCVLVEIITVTVYVLRMLSTKPLTTVIHSS